MHWDTLGVFLPHGHIWSTPITIQDLRKSSQCNLCHKNIIIIITFSRYYIKEIIPMQYLEKVKQKIILCQRLHWNNFWVDKDLFNRKHLIFLI